MSSENNTTSFSIQWEIKYLVKILNNPEGYICLVPGCSLLFSSTKKWNIQKHYDNLHGKMYDRVNGEARNHLFEALKLVMKDPRDKQELDQQKTTKIASYVLAYDVMESKKPFTEGDFVKKCAVRLAKSVGGNEVAAKISEIPSSRRTLARRSEEIGEYILEKELQSLCSAAVYVSIQLDESTDITGIAELLIFGRLVDSEFRVHEELLDIFELLENTRGIDIFTALDSNIKKFNVREKLSLICSDGCSSMTGHVDGVAGHLRTNNYTTPLLHCIVHRFSLTTKIVKHDLVMEYAVKCVNKLRGGKRSMRRRKFRNFLNDRKAPYQELLLYTEVRWLSRGSFLLRFFQLYPFVIEYIKKIIAEAENVILIKHSQRKRDFRGIRKGKSPAEEIIEEFQPILDVVSSEEFVAALAFLADMFKHMNFFNKRLQGKNQTIADLIGHIDAFYGIYF